NACSSGIEANISARSAPGCGMNATTFLTHAIALSTLFSRVVRQLSVHARPAALARTWLHVDGDGVEQFVQLALAELDVRRAGSRRRGDSKRVAVQALVEQAHPGRVREHDFQSRLALAEEHEERPAARGASGLLQRQPCK